MGALRRTGIWLALLGVLLACVLSGCKKQAEEAPAGGTETPQTAPAEPNA